MSSVSPDREVSSHTLRQAGAYAGRGLAHFYQGQLDEAIADYNRALKLNPKLAGTYLNRGYAYLKKGQYDQTLAYNNRARLYYQIKQYDLVLFLAACTFCESFRGLWWLWDGSALWMGLILACLWKVWRYAWVDS